MKDRAWGRTWLAALGLFWVVGTVPAIAEQVVMPYQCKFERGRITLVPGPERTFEILGPRRQQPFLLCATRDDSRCRLRMLHWFELSCGGSPVAWVGVAAAATRLMGREAWVDGDRLSVVLGQVETPAGADCVDTPWARSSARIPGPVSASAQPCWPRAGPRAGPHVVTLPPGFAPLGELGARLVLPPGRPAAMAPAAVLPPAAQNVPALHPPAAMPPPATTPLAPATTPAPPPVAASAHGAPAPIVEATKATRRQSAPPMPREEAVAAVAQTTGPPGTSVPSTRPQSRLEVADASPATGADRP